MPAGFVVSPERAGMLAEVLARAVGSEPSAPPAGPPPETVSPDEGLFERVDTADDLARARAALRRSLTKPTDGFFAAWIDRRISTRLSLRLAGTRLTPNAITLSALVPALAGAALLAVPDPFVSTAGAILFWLSTVLDGCDGEVARLKFQESPRGARLDILCDNVALLAVFAAIFAHVYLERPGPEVLRLGALALFGMLGCMLTEYVRVLKPRIDSSEAAPAAARPSKTPFDAARVRWYERLASRDFAYLLPFLTLTGRLSWLVWGTAIGVNFFFLLLTLYVLRPRR
jgi:1L-myo-inositol 1-phosphate cytidylyltransferase / CDP-L-myo-inositol myo-inositolphosphotransferase